MTTAKIYVGDVLEQLRQIPDESIQTVITSPPYWGLRDYGIEGQLGLEDSPEEYVEKLTEVFKEVRRVLKSDGTLWLNLGDSYAGNMSRASNNGRAGYGNAREGIFTRTGEGLKFKDLVGIPWRVAFALQADGWYLRQDIIWAKPNPIPESVSDRFTKSHEHVFLLSKSSRYFFDFEAVKEPVADAKSSDEKRRKRDVWTVPVRPYRGAHFATFPEALVEPCVLAGSSVGDFVLDPFAGSGTSGVVSLRHGRHFVGTELNPSYAELARERISMSVVGSKVEIQH